MTYFLARRRSVSAAASPETWPANLKITAILTPEEFFQPTSMTSPRVFCVKDMQFHLDSATGKATTSSDNFLPPLKLHHHLDTANLEFDGNKAILTMSVTSEQDVVSAFDWLSINVPQFISVSTGIFIDVQSIAGTINDIPVCGVYPAGSYSFMWVNLNEEKRINLINRALDFPHPASRSYPRFVISSFYFHHALRLVSPHETLFAPYYAHAEVMLNLAKSLEIAFNTNNRDQLRKHFASLGYPEEQIESQIIPIFVMRNEADIAHPRATRISPEDIQTYREYIDRSLLNVGSIFTRIAEKIKEKDDFLEPVSVQDDEKSDKLVRNLRKYLSNESLGKKTETPAILSTT